MGILVTPSILAADLAHLQDEVDSVEAYADGLQVDVMDGHFVPNLTFGAPVLRDLKTKLPLDIHLMVSNPADRVREFLDVGAKHITFHAEAVRGTAEQKELIRMIRSIPHPIPLPEGEGRLCTAGIAINPETPLSAIDDMVENIDLALVMSVHPGFAGQTFIPGVLEKVRDLRRRFPDLMIQMDGGIDANTAPMCIGAGANNLVAASFIFGAKDRAAAIAILRG